MVDVPTTAEFNNLLGRVIDLENSMTDAEAQIVSLNNLGVEHETRITDLENGTATEPPPPPPPPPPSNVASDDYTGWQTRRTGTQFYDKLLWEPHYTAGPGSVSLTEESGDIVFRTVDGGYRSEFTHQRALMAPSYQLAEGVEYAYALPFTFDGDFTRPERFHYCVQFWDQGADYGLKLPGGSLAAFSRRHGWESHIANIQVGQEYKLVLHLKLGTGGFYDVWLGGAKVASLNNAPGDGDSYFKHGIYQDGYYRVSSVLKSRMSGFGVFAGDGCLQAALQRVS